MFFKFFALYKLSIVIKLPKSPKKQAALVAAPKYILVDNLLPAVYKFIN